MNYRFTEQIQTLKCWICFQHFTQHFYSFNSKMASCQGTVQFLVVIFIVSVKSHHQTDLVLSETYLFSMRHSILSLRPLPVLHLFMCFSLSQQQQNTTKSLFVFFTAETQLGQSGISLQCFTYHFQAFFSNSASFLSTISLTIAYVGFYQTVMAFTAESMKSSDCSSSEPCL